MPTYEFRCPNGHDFEKFFRSMSGAPGELPCPVCGKTAERLMSGGAGLLFKGSGFYITDYGKDGKKSQKPAPGGEKPSSAAEAPAAKSDTKSDAGSGKSGDTKPAADKPTSAAKSNKGSQAGE